MNSQNPAKTSHHRIFSIVYEILKSAVSDQVALWFFRNLIPKGLIASISEQFRDRITFLKTGKLLPFSLKINFVIGCIPILHSHLGGKKSIKTRIDANKVKGGLVNANAGT